MKRLTGFMAMILPLLMGAAVFAQTTPVEVSIIDYAYNPVQISIGVGEQVQWINNGALPHTVTSGTLGNSDGKFDSGIIQPLGLYLLTFESPGVYPYYCTLHPTLMAGVVVVGEPTGVEEPRDAAPELFTLAGNYPNPFNNMTTISFELNRLGAVRLTVYTVAGQAIRELVNGSLDAGMHSIAWDGRNEEGVSMSSGMYLYRLESEGSASRMHRMMYLK